jgi:glycosyltransferase involved in cell wall biosynthesis
VRVTFLCPHLGISGGVRTILTYADRLAARGHEVTLVVPGEATWRGGVRPRRSADWFGRLRVKVVWVRSWTPKALPAADAVVATAWQSAPVVAAAPASSGCKLYLVQAYESLYFGPADRVDETYRLPLRKVVISTWLRDVMRERFGSDAEVIVTPVDPELFRAVDVPRTSALPRVLMLHHAAPWKGVAEGLEAVARVRAGGHELELVGFGVKAKGKTSVYDEFHSNPPQGELARVYSSCDVYLCPSWDEGLGLPAMEAMACGAALVTSDTGGCRDYARDGETALVAPRRDVGALADALARVVDDPGLRARLATAGSSYVRTAFDWDRAVARLEGLLAAGSHSL